MKQSLLKLKQFGDIWLNNCFKMEQNWGLNTQTVPALFHEPTVSHEYSPAVLHETVPLFQLKRFEIETKGVSLTVLF